MKNILVISASPRKGGNSDVLCDEFIKGAEQCTHENRLRNGTSFIKSIWKRACFGRLFFLD